jgi:hypothetical protein
VSRKCAPNPALWSGAGGLSPTLPTAPTALAGNGPSSQREVGVFSPAPRCFGSGANPSSKSLALAGVSGWHCPHELVAAGVLRVLYRLKKRLTGPNKPPNTLAAISSQGHRATAGVLGAHGRGRLALDTWHGPLRPLGSELRALWLGCWLADSATFGYFAGNGHWQLRRLFC